MHYKFERIFEHSEPLIVELNTFVPKLNIDDIKHVVQASEPTSIMFRSCLFHALPLLFHEPRQIKDLANILALKKDDAMETSVQAYVSICEYLINIGMYDCLSDTDVRQLSTLQEGKHVAKLARQFQTFIDDLSRTDSRYPELTLSIHKNLCQSFLKTIYTMKWTKNIPYLQFKTCLETLLNKNIMHLPS